MTGPGERPWIELASEALAGAGYRRGGARRVVLELLDAQPCALSAQEIEELLPSAARAVSRASVYRILDELETLGQVNRVEVGQSTARFEAARHGSGHHHHLVCDHCGTLEPFTDRELERSIARLARRVALIVSEHDVVLHGACRDCTAAAARG